MGIAGTWRPEFFQPFMVYAFSPISEWFWLNLSLDALSLQFTMFVFNLLIPMYPLDGGQLTASLLRLCMKPSAAAKVILVLSILCLCGLVWLGFYFKVAMASFLALWIASAIYQLWEYIRQDRVGEHPLFRDTSEVEEAK